MIEFPYYPLKQKKLHPAEEKMLCRDKIIEIHQTGFRGFVSESVCWFFFSLFIYLFSILHHPREILRLKYIILRYGANQPSKSHYSEFKL